MQKKDNRKRKISLLREQRETSRKIVKENH